MSITGPSQTKNKSLSNLAVLFFGICFFAPLLWILAASFDASPTFLVKLPKKLSLMNIKNILTFNITYRPILVSCFLAFTCGVVVIVTATLAAYPISRYKIKATRDFLYAILFGSCLPATEIMVLVYCMFAHFNLIDLLPAPALFMASTSLPIAIWMMKDFIDGIPNRLEEADRVDGASFLKTLRLIIVSVMRPGIAVVFIFVFIQAWGNFFVPFILLHAENRMTAAESIYNIFGDHGSASYGELAACSLIFLLPVLRLFLSMNKSLGGASILGRVIKG